MPATTMTTPRLPQPLAGREQAVDPGHADVGQPLDPVPERLGHDGRLLGDGQIAGAGRHHEDRAGAGGAPARSAAAGGRCGRADSRPCRGSAPRSAAAAASLARVPRKRPLAAASRSQIATTCSAVFPSQNTTSGCPWRSARWWSIRAKCEIFEGEVPQPLERRLGGEAPGGDVGEQGLELLGSHATWATGSRYSRKIASASAIDSIWKSRWRSVARAVQPLGVPAEVLAELDHGLAGVALEPERQPGVVERDR